MEMMVIWVALVLGIVAGLGWVVLYQPFSSSARRRRAVGLPGNLTANVRAKVVGPILLSQRLDDGFLIHSETLGRMIGRILRDHGIVVVPELDSADLQLEVSIMLDRDAQGISHSGIATLKLRGCILPIAVLGGHAAACNALDLVEEHAEAITDKALRKVSLYQTTLLPQRNGAAVRQLQGGMR